MPKQILFRFRLGINFQHKIETHDSFTDFTRTEQQQQQQQKQTYDRSEVVGLVPPPCGHVSVMNLPRPHYDGRYEMPWTTGRGRTLHGRRPGRYKYPLYFILVSIVFPTSTLLLYCLLAIVLIVLAIVYHF